MYFNKGRKQNDINISSVSKTDGSSNVITKTDSLVTTTISTNTLNATGTIKITNNCPVLHLIEQDVERSKNPSANNWTMGLQFRDKNSVLFGGVEHGYLLKDSNATSNNRVRENRLNLIVYNGTNTTTNANAQISVGYDTNGKWFTYAPKPDIGDNTNKIATTNWVKSFSNGPEFKTIVNTIVDHIVATPKATTWVGGLKSETNNYGAIINSTATSFGNIFNAPTKNYKVGLGTFPSTDDNVYLYSITKTKVNAQSPNTRDNWLAWNASNGLLSSSTGSKLSFDNGTIGTLTTTTGNITTVKSTTINSTTENTKYVKINAAHDTIGTTGLVIDGGKQNYAIAIQNTNMTKGSKPGAQQYSGIEFYGKTRSKYQNRLGLLQQGLSTANYNTVGLYAYDPRSAEANTTAAILVNFDNNGNRTVTTNVPVPANSDNSSKLATTQFTQNLVKSKLSNVTPTTVGTSATAKTGTSTLFARADHVHNFKFPKSDSDEFKKIMKDMIESLHIQYFCSDKGIPKKFYVNGKTGVDNDETHGTSLSKPWKTLEYAIKTVCTNYNMSDVEVEIRVVNSTTYTVSNGITFPNYNRTTGSLSIIGINSSNEALTGESRVTIYRKVNNGGNVVSISKNSLYTFYHINFKLEQSNSNDTEKNYFPTAIYLNTNSSVTLNGCQITFVDGANNKGNKIPQVRLVDVVGAKLNFTGGGRFVLPTSSAKKSNVCVIYAVDGAGVLAQRTNNIETIKYYVYGAFDTFFLGAFNSYFRYYGSQTYHPAFIDVSSATSVKYKANACVGKRYNITWFSFVNVAKCVASTHSIDKDIEHYFPGDKAGTVGNNCNYG